MFKTARLKLTGWYLLIIMSVSIFFSIAVYRGSTLELGRGLRLQAVRFTSREQPVFQIPLNGPIPSPGFDVTLLEELKRRIAMQLILINIGIFAMSGFAAYFLAGKTLKPIEESLDEQKRFISDASHELRTPLTALKSEIEVALRDKNLDLGQAKKLLNSNLEEVDKMQALSNYLLALDRYQSNKLKLSFNKVKVSGVISKAGEKVQKLANKKDVHILQKGRDVEIMANEIGLVELVTILLDNAAKYSQKGKSVVVSTHSDGKNIYIKVQDFGIGIKASDIPYIFNRFYRADASRSKTLVEGYGLGLSIAKSIVELHHGKISVESTVNEGSIFTAVLPLKQQTLLVSNVTL